MLNHSWKINILLLLFIAWGVMVLLQILQKLFYLYLLMTQLCFKSLKGIMTYDHNHLKNK